MAVEGSYKSFELGLTVPANVPHRKSHSLLNSYSESPLNSLLQILQPAGKSGRLLASSCIKHITHPDHRIFQKLSLLLGKHSLLSLYLCKMSMCSHSHKYSKSEISNPSLLQQIPTVLLSKIFMVHN